MGPSIPWRIVVRMPSVDGKSLFNVVPVVPLYWQIVGTLLR
jgi:hypothetical protein